MRKPESQHSKLALQECCPAVARRRRRRKQHWIRMTATIAILEASQGTRLAKQTALIVFLKKNPHLMLHRIC
ncbi:hypothetical protein Y032_0498g2536 [Ancylostoma ceylanicum]|uniref:Uncharacterized protein n=1 Tax=Ancylostoma ceylanicum TaxID=53326 RepID=A0A016WTY4_9BILA|nr:hypothetical protein Y032_0498g2536 [Ancylostoma ceylanicum]